MGGKNLGNDVDFSLDERICGKGYRLGEHALIRLPVCQRAGLLRRSALGACLMLTDLWARQRIVGDAHPELLTTGLRVKAIQQGHGASSGAEDPRSL